MTPSPEPIVISGLAVEAPGGIETPEDYYAALAAGVELIEPFPRDRDCPIDQVLSLGVLDGWGAVPDAGGFLRGAAEFDPQFFGLSPREAVAMDPQQRLALRVGWRALENAGINPAALAGDEVGVYMGASLMEYGPRAAAVNEYSGHRVAGTALGAVAGRLSHALGLIGPSMTVDTACASSLTALHLAANAIRSGECDWAIAGGVCVMGSPGAFFEFAKNNGLADDGHCRSYSAAATGTLWGEGAGAVVVEPAGRARRLGHRILGTVLGTAVNHNGRGAPIVVPSVGAQRRLIERTLAVAGVRAADIDVIEGHGTGTPLGDPMELEALSSTYGAARGPDDPVLLGSVKSNAGHAQAAAGMLGLIKILLSAAHGSIVPSLFADDPTDKIEWGGGLALASGSRDWTPRGDRRVAAVSSFGVAGTNVHAIVAMPIDSEIAYA